MRTSLLVVPLVAVTLAAGCCRQNAPAPEGQARFGATDGAPGARPSRVVPGEYIFTVAPGTTPAAIAGTFADLAPKRIQALGGDKILMVFGDDPGLSRLSFRVGDGRILAVQPNFAYQATPR